MKARTSVAIRGNNGQVVAHLLDGTTLHKDIQGSKHLLRKPAAIAFDRNTIDVADAYGGQVITVFDKETGTTYWVEMHVFEEKAFLIDRGHGEQLALPMKYWQTKEKAQGDEVDEHYTQLGLFGDGTDDDGTTRDTSEGHQDGSIGRTT